MSVFEQEGDNYEANHIITEFIAKEGCYDKIVYVLQILYALEPEIKESMYKETIAVEKWTANLDLMRQIRYRDSIVKDYPAEYFGKDYGYDDPFIYDDVIEKKINKIEMYLMAILGRIITMRRNQSINIGDES